MGIKTSMLHIANNTSVLISTLHVDFSDRMQNIIDISIKCEMFNFKATFY